MGICTALSQKKDEQRDQKLAKLVIAPSGF
jgi:hypothetical protein